MDYSYQSDGPSPKLSIAAMIVSYNTTRVYGLLILVPFHTSLQNWTHSHSQMIPSVRENCSMGMEENSIERKKNDRLIEFLHC